MSKPRGCLREYDFGGVLQVRVFKGVLEGAFNRIGAQPFGGSQPGFSVPENPHSQPKAGGLLNLLHLAVPDFDLQCFVTLNERVHFLEAVPLGE